MTENLKGKAEPQDKNKDIPKTEKENEQLKRIDLPAEGPETTDGPELTKDDQRELEEVREFLKSEMKKNDGWKVVRRPWEQWEQKHIVTTDSPVGRLKGWLKTFSKTEREAAKLNKELQREFREDRAKYPETRFEYKTGAGVEGMVSEKTGILARGFYECSGLVFQAPGKVAIVHISPNALKSTYEGGERVEDKDIWGHIRFALRELLVGKEEITAKKTENNTDLSKEEVAKLQGMIDSGSLTATMLSGEDNLVPHEIARMLGESAKFNNLPFMKTEIHYVGALGGGGGYAIYANPEEMYYIGANGKMMKKGTNLPPVMYEYKEKK